MLTVTRKHRISAAHRLYDYTGKCERLHGHNYDISITITRPALDALGMIIDFADIKRLLLTALDQAWDHKTLLYDKDPLCTTLKKILDDGSVCAVPFNPTAENMACYLGETFFPGILAQQNVPQNLSVISVTVYETPENLATWQKTESAANSTYPPSHP